MYRQGLKCMGGRSQARHFCNLAIPGLKGRFFRENARFQAEETVLSIINELVNEFDQDRLNRNTAAKLKRAHNFFTGPVDFYRSTALKLQFNPCV